MINQFYHLLSIFLLGQLLFAVTGEAAEDKSGESTSTSKGSRSGEAFSSAPALLLDEEGDIAIEVYKDIPLDAFRMLVLEEYVERSCFQSDLAKLLFGKVPTAALLSGLMRLMRLEMGLVYAPPEVPPFEQYQEMFKVKVLESCKQVYDYLGGWWEKVRSQRDALLGCQEKWLKAANICMTIKTRVESENLINTAYIGFGLHLIADYNSQRANADWFSSQIRLVIEPVISRSDTLSRLAKSLVNRYDNLKTEGELYEVPEYILVESIATVLSTEFNNELVDLESFSKVFRTKIQIPCIFIDLVLHKWWEYRRENRDQRLTDNDIAWLITAKLCHTLIPSEINGRLVDDAHVKITSRPNQS